MAELSDAARRNREVWTRSNAAYTDREAPRKWAQEEIAWGMFGVPEADVDALPDVAGKDVLELGCGTAYFSSWLARRGARVVGLDNSPQQLETARRLQAEHRLDFRLVLASADDVPLPAGSFDLVLSEYGASLWVDPYRWVPEAARLLRPGGELVFLTNGLVLMLTMPADGVTAGDRLVRDLFGMHRFEWTGDDSVEFHLPHGEWIRVLVENGFAVEALVELRAPDGGDPGQWDFVTLEWARRWPSEEIWKARKR